MYHLKCCIHITTSIHPFCSMHQTRLLHGHDISNHAERAAGYGHLQIVKPTDQQATAGRPHDPSLECLKLCINSLELPVSFVSISPLQFPHSRRFKLKIPVSPGDLKKKSARSRFPVVLQGCILSN